MAAINGPGDQLQQPQVSDRISYSGGGGGGGGGGMGYCMTDQLLTELRIKN